ncbi:hypothetical protein MHC_02965 [Mycoplasma haemocanis str. Illinois]|uniref:Uncharacterized protein n=1 Tax=Mycoplasma haemocanis (strain Illinois) TaxID=1111676 RepID=H6N733_MYCHN|nr:hypothetical protein [Mycoplasma haemocanis]AEW45455.1 hypothetical protein MHC_02965 [Mycoplasma haemocanis str. Illinois]
MSSLVFTKLAFVSSAGVVGTVGVMYVGSKVADFSSVSDDVDSIIETVSDKYKNRLIKSNSNDQKWKSRLEKLRKSLKQDLDPELEKIKSDNSKKESDLKQWCDSAAIQPWEKDSRIVKGIEDFCTLTIKDQVGKGKLISKTGTEEWKLANGKLRDFKEDKLSNEMKKLQDEIKKNESSDVLEKWCFNNMEDPFIDAKDVKYLDVSTFCVKVSQKSQGKTGPDSTT